MTSLANLAIGAAVLVVGYLVLLVFTERFGFLPLAGLLLALCVASLF